MSWASPRWTMDLKDQYGASTWVHTGQPTKAIYWVTVTHLHITSILNKKFTKVSAWRWRSLFLDIKGVHSTQVSLYMNVWWFRHSWYWFQAPTRFRNTVLAINASSSLLVLIQSIFNFMQTSLPKARWMGFLLCEYHAIPPSSGTDSKPYPWPPIVFLTFGSRVLDECHFIPDGELKITGTV